MHDHTAAIRFAAESESLNEAPQAALPCRDAARSSERFVGENYQRVYFWFWWLCGRRELAADLTQETFAAYWDSLRRKRVREPRAWLLRIARNRWRKHCRDQRSRGGSAPWTISDGNDPPSAAADGPAESASAADARRRLRELVQALPAVYREALVLRFWADLPYRDIGVATGVPAALARWRVHRGKAMLRDRMNEPDRNPTGERP